MCQNTHFERRKGPIRASKFTPRPPCLTAVDIYIYIYEKMIDKTRHNVMVNMPYRVVKQPRNALKAIWKRKRV